jgi:nitrogen fixation protein FixH
MQANQKPLTGRRVLVYLLAFFGVVVGVNLVMAKLAVDTLSGSEVDSAYRASLAYNTEISAARAQAQRHWRVAAHVERDGDQRAHVRVEARDERGAPVTGMAFAARLARPTDKRGDRAVTLAERESGVYRGETADVAGGQWDLIIEADRGEDRVFLSRNRIVLP